MSLSPEIDSAKIASTTRRVVKDRRAEALATAQAEEARRKDAIRRMVEELSPESIVERQRGSLDRMSNAGVVAMFVGVAQGLEETYPDVEVRMSQPTGDPEDVMAIGVFFDFSTVGDEKITYRQVYAAEKRDRSGFLISQGDRKKKPETEIAGEPYRLDGRHSGPMNFDYSYPNKNDLMRYAAQTVGGAVNAGYPRVNLDVQRPLVRIPHRPTNE